MVESRQIDEMADPYMYPEEGYDAYLQDADILDRPDLFYPGTCNLCPNSPSLQMERVLGLQTVCL